MLMRVIKGAQQRGEFRDCDFFYTSGKQVDLTVDPLPAIYALYDLMETKLNRVIRLLEQMRGETPLEESKDDLSTVDIGGLERL